jgi:hypothetical protein
MEDEKFHVINIDKESIGLSLITEGETPITTTPDLSYSNESEFKFEFDKIFKS